MTNALCQKCAAEEAAQAVACHATTRAKKGAPCTCPVIVCKHEKAATQAPSDSGCKGQGT